MQGLLPGDLANVRRPAAENGSYAHADAPVLLSAPDGCDPRPTEQSHPWSTKLMNEANEQNEGSPLPLLAAADLQDHLMTATHDLDRLQTLLADACDVLAQSFYGASEQLRALMDAQQASAGHADVYPELMQKLGGAVTALQFQDMASQLITHTNKRLRSCADQIARVAMGDDEDGEAVVEEAPLRPNPVTQDEMDAGSIELF